ncbi:hypothetical protein GCM10011611_30930 [Aliidongia dinghuensis]|uniref:Uncharacterized protein n=1 Tax=Aliidongia dinghuensis TaxID=1867774 RepID=A0A8J2YUF6_9PROT|nr:hypothetical protein [Aliidongia dinghuensis]GGF22679.1 hypothetical protein GCM10011611_30930 [Aliidongia dinghuensis]
MNSRFYYDGATVRQLSLESGVFRIGLECATDDDEIAVDVALSFHEIRNLQVDRVAAADVGMIEDDGEIISYYQAERHAEIVIQWNNFDPADRRKQTISYIFDFQGFDLARSPDIHRWPAS